MQEQEHQQQFLKQPKTFTVTTGDEKLGERINLYFEEVIDIIGYNRRALGIFANIEHMEIMRNTGHGEVITDDMLSWLLVQDRLVATALQRRDGFNRVQVALVCYLTPETLMTLRSDPELLADHQADTS